MKKIMFSDRYGLTAAVLQGRKTMTRRMVRDGTPIGNWGETEKYAKYKIGEVVAVTQSYQNILDTVFGDDQQWKYGYMRDVEESHEKTWKDINGRTNKMFVKADLMPHQIKITDIKIERLQDISEEDCIREGILHSDNYAMPYGITEVAAPNGVFFYYSSPREAFAALIDKVSGYGTWERNPWVFVYSFKLIR